MIGAIPLPGSGHQCPALLVDDSIAIENGFAMHLRVGHKTGFAIVDVEDAAPLLRLGTVQPPVAAAPPYVRRSAVTNTADLRDWFARQEDQRAAGFPAEQFPSTPGLEEAALVLLREVGAHFGLPVTSVSTFVARYTKGQRFREHTDRLPELPHSMTRQVSFTVLLSSPGSDFGGGEFFANGELVPLSCGDLIGFTAATPHRVDVVTSGERFVWVAFGSA